MEFDRYAPRPWQRFFAKQIDATIYGVAIVFMTYVVPWAAVTVFEDDIKWVEWFIAYPVFVVICCLVDALLLWAIGTSPGRILFKINVSFLAASKIPLWAAMKRNLRLLIAGLGLGLPIVNLLAMISSYQQLVAKRVTSWDDAEGFVVTVAPSGRIRHTVQIVLVVLIVALNIGSYIFNY